MKLLLSIFIIFGLMSCEAPSDSSTTDGTVVQTPTTPVPIYFPLTVNSPGADFTTITGSSFTYSISGGLPPYTFTYVSGPGTIDQSSGEFSSGSIAGTTTIDITDSSSQQIRVKVKVNAALSVQPTLANLNVGESVNFIVSGGVAPYSFAIESGSGFVNQIGLYTSTLTPSVASIRIYDSRGNTTSAQVVVKKRIQLTPSQLTLNRGESYQFQATLGFPPYTYRIASGIGTINIDSGNYIAPLISGTARIEVSDSANNKVYSDITINSASLSVNSSHITQQVSTSFQFNASGGLAPYVFQLWAPQNNTCSALNGTRWNSLFCSEKGIQDPDSCYNLQKNWKYCSRQIALDCDETNSMQLAEEGCYQSGIKNTIYTDQSSCLAQGFKWFAANQTPEDFCGSILGGNVTTLINSAGSFSAPLNADEIRIRLKDGENSTIYTIASITSALTISPSQLTTTPSTVSILSANGGVPPYSFRIVSGIGSISNSNQNSAGEFLSPNTTGNAVVELSDSVGTSVQASVKISPQLFISPTSSTISIGNQITFIGSGGVPPYTFDLASGTGNISPNGIYTADSGNIFSSQTVSIRLTDSSGIVKLANLTITPALSFDQSSNYVFESGSSNVIQGLNGVPPYTIKLKNSSIYGSTIQNIPNNGNYTMKYNPGFVSETVYETLVITDSLGNKAEQVVSIFGGLLSYFDPDKVLFSSSNNSIILNSISTTQNSNLLSIFSANHNLSDSTTIRFSQMSSCDNFESYEFNKRFNISYIDQDNFSFILSHKANNSMSCSNGSNFKYDVLSSSLATCSNLNLFKPLNLATYDLTSLEIQCLSGNDIFTGSCGKGSSCLDQYRLQLTKNLSKASHLTYSLPTLNTSSGFVSVELWMKWDGTRFVTNPQTNTFDGTIIGFLNYNASFMTVLDSNSIIRPSICFNTDMSQFDCFGTQNLDSLVKNKWTHYVFIFNNTDYTKNKLYINGNPQTLSKRSSTDSVNRNVSSDFYIGSNFNLNAPTTRLNADMGIIRVYNKELVNNEVINNYNENKCLYQKLCSN